MKKKTYSQQLTGALWNLRNYETFLYHGLTDRERTVLFYRNQMIQEIVEDVRVSLQHRNTLSGVVVKKFLKHEYTHTCVWLEEQKGWVSSMPLMHEGYIRAMLLWKAELSAILGYPVCRQVGL